jgi:hypothetical protein
VERNPVRANMVTNPWDHEWSGARFHVGLVPKDPLIDTDCLSAFRLTAEQWRHLLQADPPEMKRVQKHTRTGRPCGSKAFVDRLEAITGRILHRRRPGPCGRS